MSKVKYFKSTKLTKANLCKILYTWNIGKIFYICCCLTLPIHHLSFSSHAFSVLSTTQPTISPSLPHITGSTLFGSVHHLLSLHRSHPSSAPHLQRQGRRYVQGWGIYNHFNVFNILSTNIRVAPPPPKYLN